MTGRHSHSTNLLGLDWTQLLPRPADIACPDDEAFLTLTSLAEEQMSVARNLVDSTTSRRRLLRRLCGWWDYLSTTIVSQGFETQVRERLSQGDTAEVSASFAWFAGTWHPDRAAMTRLLWRISCSSILVSAAADLHARVDVAEDWTPQSQRAHA